MNLQTVTPTRTSIPQHVARSLTEAFARGLARNPGGIAVAEPGRQVTYRELDHEIEELRGALASLGVGPGDRVAMWMPKSIAAVALMQAVLRLGAAYVPIDPLSPPGRVAGLLEDCGSAVLATTASHLRDRMQGQPQIAHVVSFSDDGCTWQLQSGAANAVRRTRRGDEGLAYILYTSGSTGAPKGVCISHTNALAFIDWAHRELAPLPTDRFSSHAPFHFDLSVLDVYVAFMAGASVHLIPESVAFVAASLLEFLRDQQITVWYSVPSALMLMESVGLLDDPPEELSTILFAGEPYPIAALRRLRRAFPAARLLNLYGPTETNVCTFARVTDIPDDQVEQVPIGVACSGSRVWAIDERGDTVNVGERGELVVDGPTVMIGYWGKERHTGPYATGDIVERIDPDTYRYVGRRDGMVKLRGHRIELGEVESALLAHPGIREAVALVSGEGSRARLVALIVTHHGEDVELLDLKRHCSERLPRYMIIHDARVVADLPRTANGKLDRKAAQTIAREHP